MPLFPHIPFKVAFTCDVRADRFEKRRGPHHRPWSRVLRLTELEEAEITRASTRALVVIAEADTPHAARVARLCWAAHERHIPTLLVRIDTDGAEFNWPLHPADAVADLGKDDAALFEEVLSRCIADTHPDYSPLQARTSADVVLLTGDPRPHAFKRALDHARITGELLLPRAPRDVDEAESFALWFRPRPQMTQTTERHPLERRALPHDPRPYDATITPLDTPEERARAIACLHATHGDWCATRRLVMDCAVGSLAARARLLSLLGACLREPRASTWAGLSELAREGNAAAPARPAHAFPPWVAAEHRTGHDETGKPWTTEELERDMSRADAVRQEDRAQHTGPERLRRARSRSAGA